MIKYKQSTTGKGAIMNHKYILFDLDGTLTDPKEGITKSVEHALNHFGIKVYDLDDLIPFIGPPLKSSFQNFYALNDEHADEAVAKYREYYVPKGMYENRVFDGVHEMLSGLCEAGYTLILATSKPEVMAVQVMRHFGLDKYFAHMCGSTLGDERGTKGLVIKYALELAGITDPDDAIMVGDKSHDIKGAKENGLRSIGVLYGYGTSAELQEARPDYIVSNVIELYDLLKGE